MDQAVELQRLAELSADDLYLEVGRHLYGSPAFPVPPKQLMDLAKRWAQDNLAKAVCGSALVKQLARQDVPTQELILSVCGVIDVGLHVSHGVPALTASALIARVGLHKFCASLWSAEAGA